MTQGRRSKGATAALSKTKKTAFLAHLRSTGEMKAACDVAGVCYFTPYQWAHRSEEFAAAFHQAKDEGEKVLLGILEEEIKRRALLGKDDPGSANLLMFRTKRLDPAYRDNAAFNVFMAGPSGVFFGLDAAQNDGVGQSERGVVIDTKPILQEPAQD